MAISWIDAVDEPPELLLCIRVRELRRDARYGSVLAQASALARRETMVATRLSEVMERSSMLRVLRLHGDAWLVLSGVPSDVDPASMEGWRPHPAGPIRFAGEGADLFVLPERTWVVVPTSVADFVERRLLHPGRRPTMIESSALVSLRIRGDALRRRFRSLGPRGLLEPVGRELTELELSLQGGGASLEIVLGYPSDAVASDAELQVRDVIERLRRRKRPGELEWLRRSEVRRSGTQVLMATPLSPDAT